MFATKERIGGHYEVTETPFATDYVWVEGEVEVERHLRGETFHPWRAAYADWVKEEWTNPELQEWIELQEL